MHGSVALSTLFLASLVPSEGYTLAPLSNTRLKREDVACKKKKSVLELPRNRDLALRAKKESSKGVYARPSAAIERGSGFFIPGLEGPRVRLLFGLSLLVLTAANHFLLTTTTASNNQLAETMGVLYAILLLFQAAIEFGKESKGYVVSLDRTDETKTPASESYVQRWSSSSPPAAFQEKVEWSAATYIALTPSSTVLLIDGEDILYQVRSNSASNPPTAAGEKQGCRSALATLAKAKSDRVSIPTTHPAATALASPDDRTIVLQKIDEQRCWMVTSTQLLQSFTSEDLKWLGQLAAYVAL